MPGFVGKLSITPHNKKPGLFVVQSDFSYVTLALSRKQTVTIKAGALTNGASVPPPLNWFFPQWHPHYAMAATLHDALVGEHGQDLALLSNPHTEEAQPVNWDEAALIFKEAMKVEGAEHWKRSLFYHAVMLNKRIRRLLGIWKR